MVVDELKELCNENENENNNNYIDTIWQPAKSPYQIDSPSSSPSPPPSLSHHNPPPQTLSPLPSTPLPPLLKKKSFLENSPCYSFVFQNSKKKLLDSIEEGCVAISDLRGEMTGLYFIFSKFNGFFFSFEPLY